jgi:hypothetical protein
MAKKYLAWERYLEKRARALRSIGVDEDPDPDRWIKKDVNASRALRAFLEARGIDATAQGELYGRVYGIHNWLDRFDDREARRFELDHMERLFWTDTPFHQSGRKAIALWRLHQQLLDHSD